MVKRGDGQETWHRLSEWTKQQAPSERLAGHILRLEGFTALDPSHPLGGPDGLKDIVAVHDSQKWIAAAYFPRGQQPPGQTKKKFTEDSLGVAANNATGFVFVTNQELTLGERGELKSSTECAHVEIYHLERIAQILDTPSAYGLRLEYLDIPMSKEDQVSFFSYVEDRNRASLERVFESERLLLAEDRLRRSKAALSNHAISLIPAIVDFRVICAIITTPSEERPSDGSLPKYSHDFRLSDLRELYKPTNLVRYPMYEPAIDRYVKVADRLEGELKALIRGADHTEWPKLPALSQRVLHIFRAYDYLELLLSTAKMRSGDSPMREADAKMLAEAENDLVLQGSNALDAYRALALQIKESLPLLRSIEESIIKNSS